MSIKTISEQGYSIFPNVFPAETLEPLRKLFADSHVKRSRAGIRHALRYDPVANIAHDPRLLEIAKAVLGSAAIPYHATLFEKSPESNWLVVWHQDTALPLRERRDVAGWGPWSIKEGITYAHASASALSKVLALRLHLDDSTKENGPLRVLPGTHNRGVLTDDDLHDLSQEIEPVDCLANSGGVVAMRPLLVHSSSKSLNDTPRRVLHIEYAASMEIEAGFVLAQA
jgi:ectoine hydroxylase-related dioxygenase (phytanoyl-CoA dioxygenase family)